MQHSFRNVSFGMRHTFICFFTIHDSSSSVLKYLLCVHSRRVIFHTLSILFKSGLYGGKNINLIHFLFLVSQGWIIIAWWYLALSSISTSFFPHFLFFKIISKKFKNVSALKMDVIMLSIWPVFARTAPNKAMLFLVGACCNTGSFSSGGIHILQRVPCCWKWHSSSNQISFLLSFVTCRSFFKGLLGPRISVCYYWSWLS